MLIIEAKNLLRSILGRLSLIFGENSSKTNNFFYCNLVLDRVDGGPNRFLRNLINNQLVTDYLNINNWSLRNCTSALVFSVSWGNSFTKICKKKSIKSVLRVDGFFVPEDYIDLNYQHTEKYQRWMNKRLAYDLEAFDHIIYQSQFSKEMCDKYLYKRTSNFSIISNGTNIEHFKPDNFFLHDKLRIIVLAKHYPKHLDLALAIFQEVLKSNNNAEMTIVGPMRDGSDGTKQYVQDSLILTTEKDKINCKSFVKFDDLPELLCKHDIFLHVKVGDWCPNAVLEAMSCGLPVVCPAWGGTKEIIGDAGISVQGPKWGVDNQLIKGMSDAVLTISNDLVNYKKNARNKITDNNCIDDVTKSYLKVLNFLD